MQSAANASKRRCNTKEKPAQSQYSTFPFPNTRTGLVPVARRGSAIPPLPCVLAPVDVRQQRR
ncbi:hypothetical protein PK52_gp36 [Geobacillus phage vB_GthS_PK5.2]|nr:hypothetical protein PK52_gp36 [Geobacillus phage vB_GthS_PK5.2]